MDGEDVPNYLDAELFILRSLCRDDAPQLAEILTNAELSQFDQVDRALAILDARMWIESAARGRAARRQMTWGIAQTAESPIIGVCDFEIDSGVAIVGFGLLPRARRRGVMSTCLATAIQHVFTHALVSRIQAEVALENRASIGLLRKFGFVDICSENSSKWTLDRCKWNLRSTALRGIDRTRATAT
ncbi:ribosomal protein n-acetylase : N-acetyltransferase OS=Geobacillus stearothermophilus NUB3621 GN=H839_09908 PE=4 SV=1: Acetyltransf_3 [Gemmata massiliana]|uniref:N-acetyltransferase domain-containing protein n=1 Tax=Gemmata massiliana TaxID=1210884 RepID=A0A6P2D6M7_9BACT|nr:ribosomal protein n-acetylase : N-acetyltransferase OS=Geobacillus stearothermophilus NUB3621 GN=H839_09908 PE=4 SV=1: Acetyltransf_3 [Gemmata massiliana]